MHLVHQQNIERLILSIKFDNIYQVITLLFHEARLNWLFVRRDITAVLLPGLVFTSTALHTHTSSLIEWALTLGQSTLYFWLCLTTCCIPNQLVGFEEDRHNKPDRPLVSGMVSYRGAQVRFAIAIILLIAFGAYLEILEWACLGLFCVIVHDCLGLSHHWLTKNLFIAGGIFSIFAAAWQMVTPLTAIAWEWIGFLAGVWLVLAHIQDLRDMEGDRTVGRKTFPLVFGEMTSRVVLSLGFGLLPLFVHIILMLPAGNHFAVLLWDGILAIASWSIAARILVYRTSQADRRTYMLFTGWHCLMLTSSFFVMSV
ncbi:MAG: UbiA family prenyltransferase [Nostoc sp. ChiSLP02]|nr:UbiA family prenyltransferase [Nostoc sp. DedSLP05]MDZ8100529.1 UbiA family prenyltransferase [Nostoc sp. DedSLP01]MDZ8186422.1 UbiA family prenyltransferase [Nostoc sp. ChiSLP02]